MRVISLSVDGIRQAAKRGLYDWLAEQDVDVICLQDLQALEYELDDAIYHPEGYHAYFFDSGEKGCNGVAIYTRELPKALIYGFGFSSGVDMEGRYLQIDFERMSIGSLLAPQAHLEHQSQEVKYQFFDDLQAHLEKISHKRRDYIFCGNWSIAPSAKDVSDSALLQNQSGFLPDEQQWMRQLTEIGYLDAFRLDNTDSDEFSWWPSNAIGEGEGWRTDLHVVSGNLEQRVEYAVIYKAQQFSSHCPVIVDYDLELNADY